ncbi:MAG: hypothetical protein JWQ40_719 [Segetibacter sp.]|jgi:hypothetical protein|nr:hypothetical protein [Segetibacter sp.]
MKKIVFLLGFVLAGQLIMAQPKPTDLDKSPMDVGYYPANFPILKMRGQANGDPSARILYSRPQKKGRTIFGDEIKYNEVWRLGANESTEIEFFKNATFGGKKIPKGRYTLYCIPTEAKWTIILNKDNYNWGSFTYKSDKDLARFDVPVQKNSEAVEALTMFFDNNSLDILWDYNKVEIPVSF